MVEDTDVIFEGHELHRYLQQHGYNDYELVSTRNISDTKGVQQMFQKIVKAVRSGIQMIVPGCQAKNREVYASLQLEIEIILKSGLLLEADYQCLLSFLEPISMAEEKPLWRDMSLLCGIGICIITRVWNRNSILSSLIETVCTCITTSKFVNTWYVHQEKRKFSATVLDLLHVLKEISCQTRRIILFIQENELLLRGFTLARSRTAVMDDIKSVRSNWYLMTGLRERIAQVMQDIIHILICTTKHLVREFPLKGQLDHEHNYAAFLSPEELGITHNADDTNKYTLGYLKRLQSVNILLQSEFLRRYALCCITSLWHNEFQRLTPLLETADTVSHTLFSFVESLTFDYKFYSSYGKCDGNNVQQPFPLIRNVPDVFVGVHSARLYMQGLLNRTLQLEETTQQKQGENLDPDIINHIFTELNDITDEITSIKNSIELAMDFCKSLEDNLEPDEKTIPPSLPLNCANIQKSNPIPVGYSDFDPQVEDEVFEALVHNTVDNDYDDLYNFIEKEDKQQKECSKRMMSELKTVLVHKAEEMKKREDRVLRNKGILISEDSSGCEADGSHLDSTDVSEDDTLKSEVIDSLKSEVVDFLKSEIDSSTGIQCNNINPQTSDESWSRAGLPIKPLAKTLVGEEETFGDTAESDADDMDDNN